MLSIAGHLASIERYSILNLMARKRTRPVADSFYSGDVAALSGLTKHMVDYLCRHGLLTVSHSNERGYGKRRQFSFTDVLLARSIRQLLDAGVSVLSLRTALLALREQLHTESTAVLRDKRIVICEGVPYLSEPNKPPRDLLKNGQMVFSFVLEIERLWKTAEPMQMKRKGQERSRTEQALKIRRERIA
jgi:DNA-binding transcriptional MerR regulator